MDSQYRNDETKRKKFIGNYDKGKAGCISESGSQDRAAILHATGIYLSGLGFIFKEI